MKKDAAVQHKSRELSDTIRSHAESERFLGLQVLFPFIPPFAFSHVTCLQLRIKDDELSRVTTQMDVSVRNTKSPASPASPARFIGSSSVQPSILPSISHPVFPKHSGTESPPPSKTNKLS